MEAQKKLRKEVITLGDEKDFDGAKLKGFYGRIETSLEQQAHTLIETLAACVEALPQKTHVYAGFLGVLNNTGKQQLLVRDVLEKVFFTLQVLSLCLRGLGREMSL